MSETNVFESNPYHDVSFEISSRSYQSRVKKYFFNIYSTQNCFSRSNSILLAITPQKKIVDKFSSTLHTMKKVNIHSTSYNATFKVEKQKSRILGVYRCKVGASEQTSSRASPLYNAKVSYETAQKLHQAAAVCVNVCNNFRNVYNFVVLTAIIHRKQYSDRCIFLFIFYFISLKIIFFHYSSFLYLSFII